MTPTERQREARRAMRRVVAAERKRRLKRAERVAQKQPEIRGYYL